VTKLRNKQVHTERQIANNTPDKIIGENEKRICMLIDIAIVRESVIFTFPVKGIKHNSINREMFRIELLRVCCVFCRMKKFWISCW